MAKESKVERAREQVKTRQEKSYKTRDSSGRFGNFFDEEKIKDISFWSKIKEEVHVFDIIPYEAGPNDPNTKEGEFTYLLDLWIHTKIGPNDDQFVCPAKNYKKPCPICEYLAREQEKAEEDGNEEKRKKLWGVFSPKRRVVYNVVVEGQEDKGVQLFEVSHHFMEAHLQSQTKNKRSGEAVAFADFDEGMSIQFERKGTGRKNTKYIGHKLVPRKTKEGTYTTTEYADQVYCIDKLIHIPEPEEMEDLLYYGRSEDDEGEDSGPDKAKSGEEEVDKKEPERASRKTEANPCPVNGVFGKDFGELEACEDCPDNVYNLCERENKDQKAEPSKTEPPKRKEKITRRNRE